MLLYGNLPNKEEYSSYTDKLKKLRALPNELKEVLENIPASAHPMDVMRTGCSMLGNLEPEGDFKNQNSSADRILASLSSIIGSLSIPIYLIFTGQITDVVFFGIMFILIFYTHRENIKRLKNKEESKTKIY